MTDNQEKFFNSFEDLINASYILFEEKLSKMLLGIAECEIVLSIVEKSLTNYKFTPEKYNLNNPNRKYFPTDRKEFIAFAFSLLYEIYNHNISFVDLLDDYFVGQNHQAKYYSLLTELIVPLKEKLLSVIADMEKIYKENSCIESLKNSYKIEKSEELKNCINSFKFSKEDKEYFEYFYSGLQNTALKETCLIAIKYILKMYKDGDTLLNKILELY